MPRTEGTVPSLFLRWYDAEEGIWIDLESYRSFVHSFQRESFPDSLQDADHILRPSESEVLVKVLAVTGSAPSVLRNNAWAFIQRPFYMRAGNSSVQLRLTIRREEILSGDRVLGQRGITCNIRDLILWRLDYADLQTTQNDWLANYRPDYATGLSLLEPEVDEAENEEDRVQVKEMRPQPVLFGGVYEFASAEERANPRMRFISFQQRRESAHNFASMFTLAPEPSPDRQRPVERVLLNLVDGQGNAVYHLAAMYADRERRPFTLLSGMEQREVPFQLDERNGALRISIE